MSLLSHDLQKPLRRQAQSTPECCLPWGLDLAKCRVTFLGVNFQGHTVPIWLCQYQLFISPEGEKRFWGRHFHNRDICGTRFAVPCPVIWSGLEEALEGDPMNHRVKGRAPLAQDQVLYCSIKPIYVVL